jgi:hypothetical protein
LIAAPSRRKAKVRSGRKKVKQTKLPL